MLFLSMWFCATANIHINPSPLPITRSGVTMDFIEADSILLNHRSHHGAAPKRMTPARRLPIAELKIVEASSSAMSLQVHPSPGDCDAFFLESLDLHLIEPGRDRG